MQVGPERNRFEGQQSTAELGQVRHPFASQVAQPAGQSMQVAVPSK